MGMPLNFLSRLLHLSVLLILHPQDFVPVVLTQGDFVTRGTFGYFRRQFWVLQTAGGREQMDMLLASNGQRQGILLNILQWEVSHNKESSGWRCQLCQSWKTLLYSNYKPKLRPNILEKCTQEKEDIPKDNRSKVIEDYFIFPISISMITMPLPFQEKKINLIWKKIFFHLVTNFNLPSPRLFVFKVSFDFQKYCLSASYMPGSVMRIQKRVVYEIDKVHTLRELTVWWEKWILS